MFEQFQVKNGIDATATEGMRDPYAVPMRLTVHHPKLNVPVLWWRSVGSTHTAFVMETLIDEIARATKQDPVAYRMRLFGDKHPRHRAALQLAVDKSGYGKKQLPAGRAWGVAVHESFDSVVAYVVEASVQDGTPVLHRVTAGVHCNLAVNPRSVEAQVQGAAVMGLSMCLPGAAITLKDGVVRAEQLRRLRRAAHHRHAADRGAHRAQRRAADRHGRARPAAAGAGVRQRHRAADRQAAARAAVQAGLSERCKTRHRSLAPRTEGGRLRDWSRADWRVSAPEPDPGVRERRLWRANANGRFQARRSKAGGGAVDELGQPRHSLPASGIRGGNLSNIQ